jgi:hypothetical protein
VNIWEWGTREMLLTFAPKDGVLVEAQSWIPEVAQRLYDALAEPLKVVGRLARECDP